MKRAFALFCFLALSLSGITVSALQNVVSLRKTYELLTPASAGYPDEDYQLTNGRYGTPVATDTGSNFYRNPEYVGFRRDDASPSTAATSGTGTSFSSASVPLTSRPTPLPRSRASSSSSRRTRSPGGMSWRS